MVGYNNNQAHFAKVNIGICVLNYLATNTVTFFLQHLILKNIKSSNFRPYQPCRFGGGDKNLEAEFLQKQIFTECPPSPFIYFNLC